MARTLAWWMAAGLIASVLIARPALAQMGPGGFGNSGGGAPSKSTGDLLPPVDPKIANDANLVFARAERAYQKHDWLEAIAYYQHIRTHFSYNVMLSALAELRLGDVAFARKHWVEARAYYRNFLRLHPTHERADYAAYRLGMCAYRDIPTSWFFEPPANERDQSETHVALQVMQDFVRDYPASSYVPGAKKVIVLCEDKLADTEMYVAKFYASRKKWAGVVLRAEGLVRMYPDSSLVPQALVMAIDAHVRLKQIDEARKDYENLTHLSVAPKWIAKGKSALGERNLPPATP